MIVLACLLGAREAGARESRFDATAFAVPWGMAYTRCAVGGNAAWVAPLSQDPGVLWSNTELRLGVRDVYGWVNDEFAAFAEVTPIAFFKLRAEASWNAFIKPPVNGGLRLLTAEGRALLDAGRIARKDPEALDWSRDEGLDDRRHFGGPMNAMGFRARLMPTLQAQLGPIVGVYTFTLDYADFRGPGRTVDDVYHDSFGFTLRRIRDFTLLHEGFVGYQWLGARDQVVVGAQLRWLRVPSTGLESVGVFGVIVAQRDDRVTRKAFSPFALAQVGSFVRDPMHRGDLSWVLVVGADFRGL